MCFFPCRITVLPVTQYLKVVVLYICPVLLLMFWKYKSSTSFSNMVEAEIANVTIFLNDKMQIIILKVGFFLINMLYPHQNSDHPLTEGLVLVENHSSSEVHAFKAFNSTFIQTFHEPYFVAGAALVLNKTPLLPQGFYYQSNNLFRLL